MPSNISTGKGPPLPLPSLRLMIPPLRLVSAAIWQTVQRRHVMDYGVLEEFVTMVTAMVPELLSHRQKAQLILGLQARLVLELCRSKPMADLQTIQLHLDRIQTLTPLWGGQVNLSGSNFLALIENLLEDPDEMEHFFQEVFPVEFGPDYDAEIEIVMWKFLSRLEELLPVSNFQQILPSHTTFETKTQSYKDTESLKKHGLKCEDTKESHCRSVASDEMNLKMYSRIFPEVSSNSQDLRDNPSSEPDPNQTRTHQQHLPNPVSVKPRMGLHPHTCPHCQKKFMFIRALRTHQLTHNPLFCTLCRMKFADQDKLDRHKRVAHKPLKCTMCEDVFDWIKPLNQHYLNVHQFSGPFLCTYCQKSFSTLSARVTHERTHTGDLPYQCSQCPKKYNKSADLVEHRKLHTGEKPCLCWECGQAFTNEMKLRNHMLNVHRKPQHPCSQCDKCYGEKRTLVSHVKTCHSGVRYPCARCAKTFTSASSLTIHERIHSQQKPFKCTESECGKDFRSKKELTVHVRYHTGERPFSCQVCGKGFTQSCYLTQHMRTHTGEKPYSCSVCARSFNDSRKLKRHMMTHTKEKPYKCLRCDRAFCRPDLLKAHDKKEHVTH
uniref:C2H2-type domain-containing protein n=1 Tax=Esox lucius TaxID=8010 RepID=A0A3P8YQE2_ESOLU